MMEAVVLNSFRHEDPAVILCPVRSVCVAAVSSLLFLNRVLGLGDAVSQTSVGNGSGLG